MNKLYRFHWSCGRQGDVEGLFVADSDYIDKKIGSEVNFFSALGKYSEIRGILNKEDLEVISEDQEKIDWLVGTVESDTISGYNPLSYLGEEGEE